MVVFLSLSCVWRCALSFFFVCLLVLLPLAIAHVVGGLFCVGGYACCGVCVFSSASPCLKESPRGAPLCMHCLLLLLFVPSSCFLSACLLLSCLFFVHARARVAAANFRLKLIVLLRRSPGDSSPSARLLIALCSYSPLLRPHG